MRALAIAIGVGWVVFWIYWLLAATGAKQSSGRRRRRPPGIGIVVIAFVLVRALRGDGSYSTNHELVLGVIGAVVFAAGLLLAVWARIHLGRNWGMPMSEKTEPELVTDGPYRFVRHPIYTGILLAMVGTGLAISLWWLIACVLVGSYFIYSARVEEQNLIRTFPKQYPSYRAHTKMLIPLVL
jgi:protein-S-isoprenylcysteine O-methyltransferase Ste14